MVLQPLSNLTAPVPFLRPERWQGDKQGTRAAQLRLHEGPPFSWGTSPSLDAVSKLRLFKSPWFSCFYSCSCRLQRSCSAVFSLSSYKTEKGGVTWVRVLLECISLTLDLGQRVVPAEVLFQDLQVEVSLLLQLLLQAEGTCGVRPHKVLGLPSTQQGKARSEAGPGASPTEGSNSSLTVDSRRDIP